MKKIIIFIAIAMAFLTTAMMPSTVSAYGGSTHEWIVLQAFDLFKCPGPEPCDCPQHYYPELELPYKVNPAPNWPWWPSENGFTGTLVAGGSADLESHVFDYEVVTGTHFWDADDGNELVESYMPFTGYYENSMDEARRTLKLARELYLSGDKPNAYDYLAHVIHAIADMTVPAHAHVNSHALNGLDADAGDSYDDWCGYVGNEKVESADIFSRNHHLWTSDHARAAGGFVAIPNDAQNGALAVYNSILQNPNYNYNDGWWPDNHQLGADFYYLMYTANQYGDYFGSMGFIPCTGDGDGDTDDRRGWMNYGAPPFSNVDDPPLTQDRLQESPATPDNSKMLYCIWSPMCPMALPPIPLICPALCPLDVPFCWQFFGSHNDDDDDLSKIASVNLPYAYRAAATLIKSFRDSIDSVPPVSEISLEGLAGHDGWFRSDVSMALSATDNSESEPWDPGIMMLQWRYQEAPEDACWFDFPGGHLFTHEGIKEIKYRSIDGLGNEETPQTASIKIDTKLPDITITSPDKDGFYLTSDTLTIDFAVSDDLSGIYSFSAKLDGVDVSDGQVFDLDNMGGWHTFVVEAEDYAGNQRSLSVTFSIKIHATIDFKPDVFNLKSMGNPVITYIEFPAGYDVTQIDKSESRLSFVTGWLYKPNTKPTAAGDYDKDGVLDMMLQFDKQNTKLPFKVDPPLYCDLMGQTVTVKVMGELNDTTEFYGEDTVLLACLNCTCPLKK